MKNSFIHCRLSPDLSGNPLEMKAYFFWDFEERPKELLQNPRKKGFHERD
jgi:hypothetical protein